jgi:UDP-2,4-diacetamido-2,4,6-trideoxy-beta-L-altropyranose hydrolase
MRIVFRVDASVDIGSGHVARCLTLAKAFSSAEITFICRQALGNMVGLIRAQGFKVIELPVALLESLTLELETVIEPQAQQLEASICLQLLDEESYSLLVVDHYRLNAEFSRIMRQKCHKIMVIDDLANRVHDADVLLDQNLLPAFESRYHGFIDEQTLALLGPEFALLREEFYQSYQVSPYVSPNELVTNKPRIFVFFGGSDADNVTSQALKGIRLLVARGEMAEFDVDVVLGGSNPWKESLYRDFADCPFIHWHVQCDYMAKLMASATLALGAGGSTHWERCIMGLASLVVTVADNQVESTRHLASKGACQWLGTSKDVSAADYARALEAALSHPEMVVKMGQCARQIVNHDCGVPKVMQALDSILSRPAKEKLCH